MEHQEQVVYQVVQGQVALQAQAEQVVLQEHQVVQEHQEVQALVVVQELVLTGQELGMQLPLMNHMMSLNILVHLMFVF